MAAAGVHLRRLIMVLEDEDGNTAQRGTLDDAVAFPADLDTVAKATSLVLSTARGRCYVLA